MERLKIEECQNCKDWKGYVTDCFQKCMKPFEALEEFNRYKDLEEQGLLLRLPCKVGDTVWAITTPASYSLGKYSEVNLKHPQQKKIQSITISKNGVLYHVKDRTYSEDDIGRTVFLTQAEAEEALRRMEREE